VEDDSGFSNKFFKINSSGNDSGASFVVFVDGLGSPKEFNVVVNEGVLVNAFIGGVGGVGNETPF